MTEWWILNETTENCIQNPGDRKILSFHIWRWLRTLARSCHYVFINNSQHTSRLQFSPFMYTVHGAQVGINLFRSTREMLFIKSLLCEWVAHQSSSIHKKTLSRNSRFYTIKWISRNSSLLGNGVEKNGIEGDGTHWLTDWRWLMSCLLSNDNTKPLPVLWV